MAQRSGQRSSSLMMLMLFAFGKCFLWHGKRQINILTERYYKRSYTSAHLIMRPVLRRSVCVRWRHSPSLHRSRAWWSLGSFRRSDQPTLPHLHSHVTHHQELLGERDSIRNGRSPGTRRLRHNCELFICKVRVWLSITAFYTSYALWLRTWRGFVIRSDYSGIWSCFKYHIHLL